MRLTKNQPIHKTKRIKCGKTIQFSFLSAVASLSCALCAWTYFLEINSISHFRSLSHFLALSLFVSVRCLSSLSVIQAFISSSHSFFQCALSKLFLAELLSHHYYQLFLASRDIASTGLNICNRIKQRKKNNLIERNVN